MSQISPPVRILAVVAVAFLAIYMAVLRPKPAAVPVATPVAPAGNVRTGAPAETALGKAVGSAKGAAAAAEAQQRADAGEATQSATAAGTATKTTPGRSAAARTGAAQTMPAPVRRAIARHQVLALLFWDRASADDRAVHAALARTGRFRGKVFVRSAPIRTISRYGRITRGADVRQSPTLVVVDRRMRATTLVGYVDALTIQQAVVDAVRASGGLYRDRFLHRLSNSCTVTIRHIAAVPQALTPAQAPAALEGRVSRFDRFVAEVMANPAPARLRAFKAGVLADATALQGIYHRQQRALGAHPTAARVASVATAIRRQGRPVSRRLNHRLDAQRLVYCGTHG